MPARKRKLKANKKKRFSRRSKRTVSTILLIVFSIIVGYFGFNIYKKTEAFDSQRLLSNGSSQILDQDGEVIYTYGSEVNGKRENITYDELPQVLVDAIISAEDSRFFEHSGFDLPRIAKAFLGNIMAGGITGGGSTITQQLIKKAYFPNAEQTYTRKISEVILAIEADHSLSKEEILTLYLNKIYFGRSTNSIGISAACKYYFNKEVSEITLPEAALLAGSLNSPYNYDPYYNLEKATNRRNTILNLMVTHGYITKEECELAKKTKIQNQLKQSDTTIQDNEMAAYVDLVTAEVKQRTGLDPKETELRIYTYLDTKLQEKCTDLGNGVTYKYSDEDMRMGGCVQSSQDGRIVAVIGGKNYKIGDLSYATCKQQPGSSVKPFLDYGLAFENLDWCTGHTLEDKKIKSGFSPKNWDGKFHGDVTITEALKNSWNVPAVKAYIQVENKIGPEGVVSAMESIGINMDDEDPNVAYAIGGWNRGISPKEMCSAYATISNNGKYVEGHTINKIEVVLTNEVINVDKDIQSEAKQSDYSEASAFMIREVMLDYTKTKAGNYAYLKGIKECGAKTGTSNWPRGAKNGLSGKSRDIWMTAYTKDYICSVWMGFGQEGISQGKNTSRYKAYPAKVVQTIMKELDKKDSNKEYPEQPDTVVKGKLVKGTYPYESPGRKTPKRLVLTAWFKEGTTPKKVSTASYDLNDLSSFDVSLDADNNINYSFTPYYPAEATTNKKATAGTKKFGLVVYTIEVENASGKVLKTFTSSSATGTMDFKVTEAVKVTGYYSYTKESSITSNKITKVLGKMSDIPTSYSAVFGEENTEVEDNGEVTSTTVTVNVSNPKDDEKYTIELSGEEDGDVQSIDGSSATFEELEPGKTYTIKIITSKGTVYSRKFLVKVEH